MTAALGKWNDHSQPSIHWPPKTKEGPPVPHQSFIHSYLCHPQKTHELGECLELKILSWLLNFFSSVYQSDPDLACSLLQTLTHRFLFDSTQLCELNIMDFMALWNLPDLCSCCCLKTWVVISFAFPDFSLIWVWRLNIFTMNFHHESICSLGLPASFLVSAGMYIATGACCWIYLSGFADCLQHSISLLQAVSSHKIRL